MSSNDLAIFALTVRSLSFIFHLGRFLSSRERIRDRSDRHIDRRQQWSVAARLDTGDVARLNHVATFTIRNRFAKKSRSPDV